MSGGERDFVCVWSKTNKQNFSDIYKCLNINLNEIRKGAIVYSKEECCRQRKQLAKKRLSTSQLGTYLPEIQQL